MSSIKRLSWLIILLCCLLPALLYSLLATTTGSRWIIQQALQFSPVNISVSRVTGSLLHELTLYDVELSTPATTVTVGRATLSWRPFELFEQRLSIRSLVLEDAHLSVLDVAQQSTETEPQHTLQLPTITTPWPIVIDNLHITAAKFTSPSQTITLANIDLAASLHGADLVVDKLLIEHQQVQAQFDIQLSLQQQYPFAVKFILTNNTSAQPIELPPAHLTGTLSGTTEQLQLTTLFELADNPSVTASLTATVNQLQPLADWNADLVISKLPLTLLQPYLPNNLLDLGSLVNSASVDAAVNLNADRILVHHTSVNGLGSNAAGQFKLNGEIADYLHYAEKPERVSLRITSRAANIALSTGLEQQHEIILNSADMELSGSLNWYRVALASEWTLATGEDVTASLAGIGTQNSLALSEIDIAHRSFDASLTAQLGWLESPWAAVNISQFSGRLPLFAETYDLQLSGGFGFINGAISANQFNATVNGSQLTANGALSPSNELAVSLNVPKLSSWFSSDYAAAELSLAASISGDYLKQLDIRIEDLQLNSDQFGQWLTQQPTQITLPLDTFNAQTTELCLHELRPRNAATTCFSAVVTEPTVMIDINAEQLPLRLLNRFREADVAERIWGNVDATAHLEIARRDGAIHTMSGLFRSENTAITSLDDNLTSRLRDWQMSWSGNLDEVNATLQAYVADDDGQILGDLILTDVLSEQRLTGSLDLSINDLTLLQWLLPDLRYSGASAVANIGVSGSLAYPTFSGAVELVADEIGFAQSGLLLTKVRIALDDNSQPTGMLRLQGHARSGTGWISIDGIVNVAQRELNLAIDGDSFRAVELAMAEVDVSPELLIKVANQRIDISGTVTVPYARINEPDLSSSATVTNDVRLFINGDPVTSEDDSLYPIHANIRVILSDNVAINAYGFEGKVSGSIGIFEEPNKALRATGSIQVAAGNYEIYGQKLEIQRGVLIYNGGAIDNPGLDLRVVRTAASMTAAANEQVAVGAQVGGTLLAPDFRLFSSPTMQDADILSYLILGRPPGLGGENNLQLQALLLIGSQGTDLIGKRLQQTFGFDDFGIDSTADPLDTSFYVGKYLSPKLYVKYGVGLFENTNTFYIRYLLSDKLVIESTSSTEAQGGDILYTIEK